MEKKQKPFKESVDDEIMEESTKGGILSKIKGVFQKAISCVNEMVHSHAKVLSQIMNGISIICFLIQSDQLVRGLQGHKNIRDGKKENHEFTVIKHYGDGRKDEVYHGDDAIKEIRKNSNRDLVRAAGWGAASMLSKAASNKLRDMDDVKS